MTDVEASRELFSVIVHDLSNLCQAVLAGAESAYDDAAGEEERALRAEDLGAARRLASALGGLRGFLSAQQGPRRLSAVCERIGTLAAARLGAPSLSLGDAAGLMVPAAFEEGVLLLAAALARGARGGHALVVSADHAAGWLEIAALGGAGTSEPDARLLASARLRLAAVDAKVAVTGPGRVRTTLPREAT